MFKNGTICFTFLNLDLLLTAADNSAINSSIVGSFTFVKLSKKSWAYFCTLVNVKFCVARGHHARSHAAKLSSWITSECRTPRVRVMLISSQTRSHH